MGILTAVFRGTAEGIVRIVLIQPVILIQHGSPRCLQGWDAVEQIPQALKMVFHLTAAAHYIAAKRILNTVSGTTCNIHSLQNMDMLTLHLAVAY